MVVKALSGVHEDVADDRIEAAFASFIALGRLDDAVAILAAVKADSRAIRISQLIEARVEASADPATGTIDLTQVHDLAPDVSAWVEPDRRGWVVVTVYARLTTWLEEQLPLDESGNGPDRRREIWASVLAGYLAAIESAALPISNLWTSGPAQLMVAMGDRDGARAWLGRWSPDPAYAWRLMLRDAIGDEAGLAADLARSNPGNRFMFYVDLAERAYRAGDDAAASRMIDRAGAEKASEGAEGFATWPRSLCHLAFLVRGETGCIGAYAAIDFEAIRQDDNRVSARLSFAALLNDLGRHEAAAALLADILERLPADLPDTRWYSSQIEDVRAHIARELYRAGEIDAAAAFLVRSMTLRPERPRRGYRPPQILLLIDPLSLARFVPWSPSSIRFLRIPIGGSSIWRERRLTIAHPSLLVQRWAGVGEWTPNHGIAPVFTIPETDTFPDIDRAFLARREAEYLISIGRGLEAEPLLLRSLALLREIDQPYDHYCEIARLAREIDASDIVDLAFDGAIDAALHREFPELQGQVMLAIAGCHVRRVGTLP